MLLITSVAAQTEILSNQVIIDMASAGISDNVIIAKISESRVKFDTSTAALISLRQKGVSNEVLSAMIERSIPTAADLGETEPIAKQEIETYEFSETVHPKDDKMENVLVSPKEAIKNAKTIAFKKSSAQPSRQNLEKALLKNPDFQKSGLTILRIKEEADLFVEIGFVSGSWITHRYVYRIYDRRSGVVLAAGETTSWGSLAENLARHISRSLKSLSES
ncbi:MAG: hypothetical protein KF685_03095 [Acidobacteria bacterium]|nr:hypothetical protein [Acidobacteriota bacterium]